MPVISTGTEIRVDITTHRSRADNLFRGLLLACASTVLVVIVFIVWFLAIRVGPAFRHQGMRIFTSNWNVVGRSFGFRGDLVGSAVIAIVALTIAFPLSVGTALAINEYVPRQVKSPLTTLVDLLAAVPSLIFGLWGKYFLDKHVYRTTIWMGHHLTFIPVFRLTGHGQVGNSLFLAGIVVAIMILPIITAISREVMSQVPREDCEAALALGGTRWGMITEVILPFSRSGIVGGAMLGLGRALGETVAVSIVLLSDERITGHILQAGGGSVSALIVREYNGAGGLERSALTLAGLTLFAVTLSVNLLARAIVTRTSRQP